MPTPDGATRGSGPGLAALLVVVVGALIVGFGIGNRLAPAPAPVPTSIASNGSLSDFPPVRLGSVDDGLKQAYYAAGAGTAVCVVDRAPVCHQRAGRIEAGPTLPPSFEQLMALGPVEKIDAGSVVVVEDIGAPNVDGMLYMEDSFPFGEHIRAVDPNEQGIQYLYIQLGFGRSVFVVSSGTGHRARRW